MRGQYRIFKLINNNVVFSENERGKEIIVFGKAIGFGKKRGDLIDNSQIIKIFEVTSAKERNYLTNLMEDIDPLYLDITAKIVTLFETELHTTVRAIMNISLSDHISNAVINKKEGLDVPLNILQEIKSAYEEEFMIAEKGLSIIKDFTGVQLSEHEAGYIVLHYINSIDKKF